MVPLPAPAAIAGTVANAINKTMPIQRDAMCASFDPARNETCARARFSPYALPPLRIIGDTQHFVCGLYAFRSGYEKVTARFQVAKETAVGASRCAVKAAEKGGGTLRSSPYAIFGFV